MNSQLVKYTRALFIFLFFIMLGVLWEYFLNDRNTTKEIDLLTSSNYEALCKSTPPLSCYFKVIPTTFDDPTPFRIIRIVQTNKVLYKRSLLNNRENIDLKLNYLRNWSLILDHLNNFSVATNDIHFFQVFFLPAVKLYLKIELTAVKGQLNGVNDLKIINKIKSTNIQLF